MTRSRTLLAALGMAVVLAALAGRMDLFVRPWFVPVVVAMGIAVVVCAVRGTIEPSRRTLAVLVLPVAAAALLTPQRASRLTTNVLPTAPIAARIGDSNALLDGDSPDVTLLDIAVAEQRLGPVALAGREVRLQAIVEDPGTVTRLAMVCCAADARPIRLPVVGSLPARGTWVDLSGALTAREGGVVLLVDTLTVIPTPDQPFL